MPFWGRVAIDVVHDAKIRSEYLEAWRRSGVTLANDYGHMFCSWRTEGYSGLVNDAWTAPAW